MSVSREPLLLYGWVTSAKQLASILSPMDKNEYAKGTPESYLRYLSERFQGRLHHHLSQEVKGLTFEDILLLEDDYACFGLLSNELTNEKTALFSKMVTEYQSVMEDFLKGLVLEKLPSFSTVIYSY
jgi:hypothetical protein